MWVFKKSSVDNHTLVIIILKPEAHKMACKNNHIRKINRIVEKFRVKY
ncbi:type II toxin-antitoxin system YafO family toxin [Pectobacterium aquaticum]|nr:type II toxin-antitoxin system YafO family toxin [Pectobacterium brasiliense]MBN3064371.1 type II toxin-antitoxin system YafO family toxin [Pectobacterium aquaticum]